MTGEVTIMPPLPAPKKGKGGARVNAGRKPGSKTKKRAASAVAASEAGIEPITVMLGNMRFYHARAESFTQKLEEMSEKLTPEQLAAGGEKLMEALKLIQKIGDWRMKAQNCAADAAPYVHPRLTAVAVKLDRGDSKRPMLDITPDMSPKVAAEVYARMLAQDG